MAAAGPFAKAAGLLEDLAGVHLTAKRVERSAEASGTARAAADRSRARAIAARRLVPLPPSPLPDKLYAAIDGTGVPVTARETAGRDGKAEDGRARTREVKLAVFFTQDKVDHEGYPARDPDSSSYIATFEPAHVFADLVEAEGIRRGAHHIRQFTIPGDGAPWIWNIASSKFPDHPDRRPLPRPRAPARPRPDPGIHARGPARGLARRPPRRPGPRRHRRHLRSRPRLPPRGRQEDELDTALGYFENNAPRMRCKWFRSRGLFVGSGTVEAGCKTVVGQRLKWSGMRWTVRGADAIIALRCTEASASWEEIWQRPRNQTALALPCPDKLSHAASSKLPASHLQNGRAPRLDMAGRECRRG